MDYKEIDKTVESLYGEISYLLKIALHNKLIEDGTESENKWSLDVMGYGIEIFDECEIDFIETEITNEDIYYVVLDEDGELWKRGKLNKIETLYSLFKMFCV